MKKEFAVWSCALALLALGCSGEKPSEETSAPSAAEGVAEGQGPVPSKTLGLEGEPSTVEPVADDQGDVPLRFRQILRMPEPPDPKTFDGVCRPELTAKEAQNLLAGSLHFVATYKKEGASLARRVGQLLLTLTAGGLDFEELKSYRFNFDDKRGVYHVGIDDVGYRLRVVYTKAVPGGQQAGDAVPHNLFKLSSYVRGFKCTEAGPRFEKGPLYHLIRGDLKEGMARSCAAVAQAKAALKSTASDCAERLKDKSLNWREKAKLAAACAKEGAKTARAGAGEVKASVKDLRLRTDLLAFAVNVRSTVKASRPGFEGDRIDLSMTTPETAMASIQDQLKSGNYGVSVDGTHYTSVHYNLEQTFKEGFFRILPDRQNPKVFHWDGAYRAKLKRGDQTWFLHSRIDSQGRNWSYFFCDEDLKKPYGKDLHDEDLAGGTLTRPDGSTYPYRLEKF